MTIKFSRKRSLVLALVAALAISAAAIAYWTTSGTGAGSATSGTHLNTTVTQVGTIAGLVPGGTAQQIGFKINNSKTTPQYVRTVAVAITSIKDATNTTVVSGCTTDDFTLVQPTAINLDLPSGDSTFSPSGATLAMNNLATDQDACKDVTVNLSFTATADAA
jgi:hypothetical protein